MTKKLTSPISIALIGAAIGLSSLAAQASEPLTRAADSGERPFGFVTTDGELDANREVEMFVRFDMPSVAEYCVAEVAGGRSIPSADLQRAHAARVDAQQASLRGALQAAGARELSALRVGANGVRVMVPALNVDQLKQLTGVRSVAPVN